MKITLHIDCLSVTGISLKGSQRDLLRTAIEQELAHLLHAAELPTGLQQSHACAAVSAPRLQLKESSPAAIGKQVAQAVYKSFGTSVSTHRHGTTTSHSRGRR